MNRHLSREPRTSSRLSESISKRNYSANVIHTKKGALKFGEQTLVQKGYSNQNGSLIKEDSAQLKQTNLNNLKNIEKFIFLNQQLKENDPRKKNMTINRKITSAEPNIIKTKISKNIDKLSNEARYGTLLSKDQKEFINLGKFNYVFMDNDIGKKSSYAKEFLPNVNQLKDKGQWTTKLKTVLSPIIKHSNKPFVDYFVQLMQNTRETMEDFHLINTEFNLKQNQALFGVFDGHGGVDVAKKLKDELSSRFAKIINCTITNDTSSTIENLIRYLFKKFDEDIIKQYAPVNVKYESTNFSSLGSTCTLVYLVKEIDATYLYCANIGDTRGLLISKGGATRITYEHKPSDDFENKRIKANGGVIFGGRLFGQFSLTRAFGNFALKKWVISEPFIKKLILTDQDKYVVIASDGIWDVITDDNCFEISLGVESSKEFCEELINTAVSRWSKDNLSCVVIRIN